MLELLLVLFVILAVVGLSVYFLVDFNKHKNSNIKDFERVDTNLGDEKKTRLANLKYVVDQVNDTNKEMDTTYTTKFDTIEKDLKDNVDKYTKFESGFGTIIQARDSKNVVIPVTQLSTLPATDLELMKHVSVVGGATIKDLEIADKKGLSICGKKEGTGDPRCIKFPNSEGDTYITNLVNNKGIILDGAVKSKGMMHLYGNMSMYSDPTATNPAMTIGNTSGQTDFTTDNTVAFKTSTAPATDIIKINKDTVEINATNIKLTGNVTINGIATGNTSTVPNEPIVMEEFCGNLNNNQDYSCKVGTDTINYYMENGKKRMYTDALWRQSGRTVPPENAFSQECGLSPLAACPSGPNM